MINSPLQACIFDLDGVLVDTTIYHYHSWKDVFKSLDYDFKLEDNEPLKGASRMHSLEIILELAGMHKSTEEKEELCYRKNEIYLNSIKSMSAEEVLPGVIALLKDIQADGLSMAVGSASKNAGLILQQCGIDHMFETVVDGNAVSRGKPDPEVFLLAAERLGVSPRKCVVFEDAAKGVDAARNAGMKVVGIGDPQVLQKADLVIPSFADLSWSQLKAKVCS